jgi:AcrR family transcriptional regulator
MASSTRRSSRPRRLKGYQRREQLLNAAVDLVEAEGVGALTMERLASRAEVSKPVLYSHFDNRGALLLAVLERCWAELDRRVAARLKATSTFDDHLRAIVEGYFDAIAEAGPVFHNLLVNESYEPVVEVARSRRFRDAEAQWSAVYQSKCGLPPAVADVMAALLRGALESGAGYWLRSDSMSRDMCVEACLAVFRGSLAEVMDSYQDWA